MIRRAAPNTIDQLKLFVIVILLVDHVGYFLFSDALWLRVIGSVWLPVWMFIIGFEAVDEDNGQKIKRDIPLLVIGTILLEIGNYAVGEPIFPLSVLLTILSVRMLLAAASIRSFIDKKPYIFLLYSLLALPSLLLVEYGSLAVMFALLGFLVRKVDVEEKTQIIGFAAIVSYAVTLDLTFALNTLQEYGVAAIVFAAVYVTAQCSVKPSVALQKNPALVKSICFLTRYMYGYYILHILLLKALSIWLYPPEEIFVLRFF